MKLKNYKPRTLGKILSEDFFDHDNFLDERMWKTGLMKSGYWNRKTTEPAMNIRESETHFEIDLAAPGFTKKDFKITIDNGCLNIAAEKESTDKERADQYSRQEFNYFSFKRSMQLPEIVQEDDIKAKYNNGILNVRLIKKAVPKRKPAKVIEVK